MKALPQLYRMKMRRWKQRIYDGIVEAEIIGRDGQTAGIGIANWRKPTGIIRFAELSRRDRLHGRNHNGIKLPDQPTLVCITDRSVPHRQRRDFAAIAALQHVQRSAHILWLTATALERHHLAPPPSGERVDLAHGDGAWFLPTPATFIADREGMLRFTRAGCHRLLEPADLAKGIPTKRRLEWEPWLRWRSVNGSRSTPIATVRPT